MKDIFTIREYAHEGIKVLLQVDSIKKEVSLVEYDSKQQEFVPKKWLFSDRAVGYAASWIKILAAMQKAVEAGVEELRALENEETEHMAELVMAVNEKES